MKKILWIILSIMIASCATLGSKTLYKSDNLIELKNIGCLELYYSDELNSIFPNADRIFYKSMIDEYYRNINDTIPILDHKIDFNSVSKSEIAALCNKNNLNGIIIPSLKFIRITKTVYFIPYSKYIDTDVELKLFDSNGDLVINTRHRTATGNSYFFTPTTEQTITDGAKGALRKLLQEYKMLKK